MAITRQDLIDYKEEKEKELAEAQQERTNANVVIQEKVEAYQQELEQDADRKLHEVTTSINAEINTINHLLEKDKEEVL